MSDQPSNSIMFRCDKCSGLFKGKSEFWNHLSSHHLKYYPYRCNYCEEAGEIHFTATEDKMKKHTETCHRVKDLHVSIQKKHDVETQLQVAIRKCRLKRKLPSEFRDALQSMTADSPTGIKRALCLTNDALNCSILMGSKLLIDYATSSQPIQRDSNIEASVITLDDTSEPLPLIEVKRKMACSKFVQDTILEMLRFCAREKLERHSIVSRQLRRLIARNFPSKPYRIFDSLDIFYSDDEYSYSLRHQGIKWHPNRADYSVQQFLDGKKCDQQDVVRYRFYEMQPYLAQSVRVKRTFIYERDDSTIMNLNSSAEMETISHLWSDQELTIGPNDFSHYFTDAMIQRIHPGYNPETISQVRMLTLNNPDLSFKDYPMLYSTNILCAVYISLKNPMNLFHFLEKPEAKPLIVLDCYFWNSSASVLIELISQSFSSASTVSAFRLIIIFCEDGIEPPKEFRIENLTTNEVLQVKKVTEKEAINYCGEYIPETNAKYIIVERSRL